MSDDIVFNRDQVELSTDQKGNMTTEFDSNEPASQPIAHKWFDFPEQSMRRLCSLYSDGTVSFIDRSTETEKQKWSKFNIPVTKVNPFLLSVLWLNTTSDDQEAFKVKHAEQIKEAAWLLGSE